MGKIRHHVELFDSLQAKKINGKRFRFGKNRRQHVAAVYLFLAATLDMGNGPLQHPVKADSLNWIMCDSALDGGQAGIEKILEFFLYQGNITATGIKSLNGQIIVKQAVENMLDSNMFMLANLGFPDGPDQGHF